ncbi:MAG: sporulation transcriptional regulator SpoIIID [Clostridia bacterium]|jgi:putative DeoR family transcriptional regulator (stage III sporulation protein D)|nr:sporulation transcriptional regulator SpoIIID [Clostridia bacterium]
MKDHIEERVLELARYITETKATVRAAARAFAVSKSTVHKDMTERLFILNRTMYGEVKAVLEKNKSERHIRGGEATRAKYRAAK